MCNHSYTANYAQKPRSMGQQCPYPACYEKARSTALSTPETGLAPVLPVDDRGTCIFHSQDIAWKRKNDFKGQFLQLVRLLDADAAEKYYDFAEFVFVGNEVSTKNDVAHYGLHIADTTFQKEAYFTGASFLDAFELDGVDFQRGANFDEATFAHDLRINSARFFQSLDFANATVSRFAFFTKVEFRNFTSFHNTRFTGATNGYVVKFEDSHFQGITDFSSAAFLLGAESSVGFLKVQFEDFTDFGSTLFHSHVVFSDVSFGAAIEFLDTSFATVRSSARYRGAAVDFKRIEVTKDAVLTFRSTDPQNKMFNHDVGFSFSEDPAGIIRFENVNFSKIITVSRDRLTQFAKSGRVEIGLGCIKYRFQTDVRTISVGQGNAPLIIELCQTFTNYFTARNGLNLGFEIVERDSTKVSFFYFTDEDISQAAFLERLAQTEQSLWNLLSIRSNEQLLALEAPAGTGLSTGKENAVINAVDGISALLGTFFRVGARIALGVWKGADTKALLSAIRFNDEGAENRALNLHRVIIDKYTDRALILINDQQNRLVAPIVVEDRHMLTPGKVRILFLGANSSNSPLMLDQEVRKIDTNLKLAKDRDNLEFEQKWAVTVDTLTQAMLDESPTIVHFSGHGEQSGILLEDEIGRPKVVSTDALSSLFKLFQDTVRCVVLNSCYSEHQAQAIRRHIPHVIGMSSSIPDLAALAFSTGFYKAIGAGRDIPFAFALGKAAIKLEGVSGEDIPVLL
jgi:hypothetical protein